LCKGRISHAGVEHEEREDTIHGAVEIEIHWEGKEQNNTESDSENDTENDAENDAENNARRTEVDCRDRSGDGGRDRPGRYSGRTSRHRQHVGGERADHRTTANDFSAERCRWRERSRVHDCRRRRAKWRVDDVARRPYGRPQQREPAITRTTLEADNETAIRFVGSPAVDSGGVADGSSAADERYPDVRIGVRRSVERSGT